MVPEVLVLDYDRTLASVDLPNERLLKLVDPAELPVSSEDIREARRDAESQHQSFATYEYLSQRLQETADPHDTTQAWRRQLTRIYRQFFLNSDSEELLFYDDAVHFFDLQAYHRRLLAYRLSNKVAGQRCTLRCGPYRP